MQILWPTILQSRQSAKPFLQSSELGLPQPFTRRRMCPPPLWFRWFRGQRRTRWRQWRERGWESPNSDEGAYTVVLYLYMYFVFAPHPPCVDPSHSPAVTRKPDATMSHTCRFSGPLPTPHALCCPFPCQLSQRHKRCVMLRFVAVPCHLIMLGTQTITCQKFMSESTCTVNIV